MLVCSNRASHIGRSIREQRLRAAEALAARLRFSAAKHCVGQELLQPGAEHENTPLSQTVIIRARAVWQWRIARRASAVS